MNNTAETVQKKLSEFGYQARVVSILHLHEIQETVEKLIENGALSKQLYENWHFYKRANDNLPDAKTIIIIAIPQSITRLSFKWQGNIYHGDIAPQYIFQEDESRVERILNNILSPAGHNVAKASLALKTLAAHSGLAKYGKNNITYIRGMGSLFRLVGFYTDIPCKDDFRQTPEMMEECTECSLCQEICPAGSISSERFLIRAEKCPGFLSEKNPDFPYWVNFQSGYKTAFVGCILCQSVCPVNRPYMDNIIEGPTFTEEETGLILDNTPFDSLSEVIIQKLGNPAEGLYRRIPANLKALIEVQSSE